MEVIYRKSQGQEGAARQSVPERRQHAPSFFDWEAESRRTRRETREWIRKRGYRKPDNPSCTKQVVCSICKLSPAASGYRDTFLFRRTGDERFDKEMEYWKGFLRKTAGEKG